MQSKSNRSPPPIPYQQGKEQGSFADRETSIASETINNGLRYMASKRIPYSKRTGNQSAEQEILARSRNRSAKIEIIAR